MAGEWWRRVCTTSAFGRLPASRSSVPCEMRSSTLTYLPDARRCRAQMSAMSRVGPAVNTPRPERGLPQFVVWTDACSRNDARSPLFGRGLLRKRTARPSRLPQASGRGNERHHPVSDTRRRRSRGRPRNSDLADTSLGSEELIPHPTDGMTVVHRQRRGVTCALDHVTQSEVGNLNLAKHRVDGTSADGTGVRRHRRCPHRRRTAP